MKNSPENEVKLLGEYNNQLKYSDCSVKDTLAKISSLLNVLDIKQDGMMRKKRQRDIYYDTIDQKIKNKAGSARIRIVKKDKVEKTYMTLKTKANEDIVARQDALVRNEKECEVLDSVSGESILQENARSIFGFSSTEKLIKQVEVNNERNYCNITTDIATYELSYDKFKYTNPVDNSESHYYYEIEIELNKEDGEKPEYEEDKKIASFIKLLKEVMGFQHDGKNKYIRGIEWKNKRNNLCDKIFVVFDIVGYSKNYSEEQKKKVEKFTDYVKKCLPIIPDTKCIPLGDGMILILPEESNVFPFISDIFQKINRLNNNREEREQIHIRTSLHIGKVMTYYDINENQNYAGDGINIAYRINSGADSGQILVSEDFYMHMKHKGAIEEENYEKMEPLTVKHKVKIDVYNYYDPNLVVGKRPS